MGLLEEKATPYGTPTPLNLIKGNPYGKGSGRPVTKQGASVLKALLDINSFLPVTGDIQSGLLAANDVKNGDYKSAALNAVGLLPFLPSLHTVWHGSPHVFDKFDMNKIGTGEGAQAYGHGLYFAENPEVAKKYQGAGAKMPDPSTDLNGYVKWLRGANVDDNSIISMLKNDGMAHKDALKIVNDSKLNDGSALYKVDIPDEAIPKMLDWDKPLSEQHPDVQKAISQEIKRIGGSAHNGQTAYKELMFEARMNGNKADSQAMRSNIEAIEASKRLKELGIPGIRYLDGGSRGAGQGSYNYVVFDDNLPKILERNGQPLKGLLK